MERFKRMLQTELPRDMPTVAVDPKKDLYRGKRFDGSDRVEDIYVVYFGQCFCGAADGVKHHHKYVVP